MLAGHIHLPRVSFSTHNPPGLLKEGDAAEEAGASSSESEATSTSRSTGAALTGETDTEESVCGNGKSEGVVGVLFC